MLVLSRKVGEVFWIGENVKVTILEAHHGKSRVGIEAPKDVPVHRQEVRDAIEAAQKAPKTA